MVTHSSILAWQATVRGVTKSQTTTERLHVHTLFKKTLILAHKGKFNSIVYKRNISDKVIQKLKKKYFNWMAA